MTLLPDIVQGDELPVKGCGTEQKQTRPRPLHTESSLLAAMETAGRELSDEAEREAMKDAGIGTPATRAAIIETLFAREYVRREKKSLVPTDKGLAVYAVVRDKKIADVAMTGGWELALSKIATGEMDAPTFHRGIEVFASQIAKELLEVTRHPRRINGGAPLNVNAHDRRHHFFQHRRQAWHLLRISRRRSCFRRARRERGQRQT